jgi:hypothetical protein
VNAYVLAANEVSGEYKVSVRITYCALAMLAANRYLSRPGLFRSYSVIWQAAREGD